MEEEARAGAEGAKTLGKAVDAGREFGGFVARLIRGPAEQAAGIIEDRLKYVRWERAVRLMRRAREFARQEGVHAMSRPVPLNVAIRLLEAASLEEDDAIQDRFAKLLVNASDADRGVDVRRMHVAILEQLGSLEVAILERVYSLPEQSVNNGVWTQDLPDVAHTAKPPPGARTEPSPTTEVALENLERLACLRPTVRHSTSDFIIRIKLTSLGRSLYDACTLPADRSGR